MQFQFRQWTTTALAAGGLLFLGAPFASADDEDVTIKVITEGQGDVVVAEVDATDVKKKPKADESRPGWLGVAITAETDGDVDSATGLAITEVIPKSPASKSGLAEGDVILSIEGEKLESISQLQQLIGDRDPGDKVSVVVQRGDDPKSVTVTIEARPDMEENEAMIVDLGGQGMDIIGKVREALKSQEMDEEEIERILKRLPKMGVNGDVDIRVMPKGNFDIEGLGGGTFKFFQDKIDPEAIEKRVEEMQKNFRQFRLGPMMIEPGQRRGRRSRSQTIRIEKSGDGPAKISGEIDGEAFSTTEDKLDELPESIRDRVKSAAGMVGEKRVGKARQQLRLRLESDAAKDQEQRTLRGIVINPSDSKEDGTRVEKLESTVNKMQQQLDLIQKMLEKMSEKE